MNHLQMLQALATLDRRHHLVRPSDASDIDLWLRLAGARLDLKNLSDKTLEISPSASTATSPERLFHEHSKISANKDDAA